MNPHDLPRRSLGAGDLVSVRSRRGAMVVPLVADETVAMSHAYLPMHWGDTYVSGAAAAACAWPA